MSINAHTLIFFDASCLVAAAGSPAGGSGFLLTVCSRQLLKAAVSQPVLVETERNVIEQVRPEALDTFHRFVATTPWTIVPLLARSQRHQYEEIVGANTPQ
jgi:hypothetical protein